MKRLLALAGLLACANAYAGGSIGTSVWIASDTDDNKEKNAALIGWLDVGDSIAVGLSQTFYHFDNEGDRREGENLVSDLVTNYALRLLNAPDADWPTSRRRFIDVYGVDPESATVAQRNAAIANVLRSVRMNDYKESFQRKSVMVKGDIGELGYFADLGATSFEGTHFTGNATLTWHYSETTTFLFDFDRSLADVAYAYSATNCGVSATMVCDPDAEATIRTTPSATVDFASGRYGIVAIGGRSHYSDGNDRDFIRTKWYYVVSEEYGVNIYFKTRNFSNSENRLSVLEVSERIADDQIAGRSAKYVMGSYYSPEDYGQYSLGLGIRKRIVRGQVFSGYIEQGRQDADGEWSNGFSWRLQYDVDFPKSNYVGQLLVGQDGSSSDYKYNYMQLQLTYKFP